MVPHSNPEKCRSRPIELLRALTKEGYGLHLFEPRWFEKDAPQQSFKSPTVVPTPDKSQIVHGLKDACADDALWLVPAVVQYVKETGELSFLGESVTYADGGESAMVSFLHVWALDNFVQLASRLGRTVDAAVAAGVITEHNPTNEYIDSILSAIDVEAIKNAQLRIALDPMYGVSQTSLSMILMTCRCDLEIIHDRHDTLFGGKLPAPNEDALGPLAAVVMDRYRCDLGIATDGDADRLGVIDDQGQFVHPNKLLVLLYYYLVKYRGWQGPCVRNNSTTVLLDRVAAGLGQKCYEVPVGFKWVSAKMTETNAIIGGESSGGLAVRGHISGKDGIYAAALLVEMLAVTGKKLSVLYREIEAQYGALSYAEASFTMTPARKLALQQYLFGQHACPEFECVDHISREDGCKVYFTDGSWVICRFSGTEPLLRMAAEAETDEKAQSYIQTWKAFLSL